MNFWLSYHWVCLIRLFVQHHMKLQSSFLYCYSVAILTECGWMCGEQFADLGPYVQDYNRSGRYLVLAGRKGHLAIMDWKQARLIMELQVAFHLPWHDCLNMIWSIWAYPVWWSLGVETSGSVICMFCCPAISCSYTLNSLHNWQVRETVRDVKYLHNELFFAVAQKKYVLLTSTLTAVVDVQFE